MPFTSRSRHTSSGVSTNTSTNLSSPTSSRARARTSSLGATRAAIAMRPWLLTRRATSATRRRFSERSWELKPRSRLMPRRTFSPSSRMVVPPRSKRRRSRAVAMVDLPAAVSPVSSTVQGCWPNRADRSAPEIEEACRWRPASGCRSQADDAPMTIPAPTVALDIRSTRMNDPVLRFSP